MLGEFSKKFKLEDVIIRNSRTTEHQASNLRVGGSRVAYGGEALGELRSREFLPACPFMFQRSLPARSEIVSH